jgi:hypothetical protein
MAHAQKPDFEFLGDGGFHVGGDSSVDYWQLRCAGQLVALYCSGEAVLRGLTRHAGYQLHSPVAPSFPLPLVAVCHVISVALYVLKPPSVADSGISVLPSGSSFSQPFDSTYLLSYTIFIHSVHIL